MFEILDGGKLPKIKTEFSSSADLCSRGDITIGAGETKIIPLGVKIDQEALEKIINVDCEGYWSPRTKEHFLKSHFLELKLRSSLAIKAGLIIANGTGEIDLDYPDEIGLIVHNPIKAGLPVQAVQKMKKGSLDEREDYSYLQYLGGEVTIKAGERVAQIKLMPHKNYLMPNEYRSTDKRVGGFGSTGSEG